jgi:hypothetical protein
MEHEKAMTQMRTHLARAESELQSAQRFLDVPPEGKTDLVLARSIANARTSINDAMDTIQQRLSERGASQNPGPNE